LGDDALLLDRIERQQERRQRRRHSRLVPPEVICGLELAAGGAGLPDLGDAGCDSKSGFLATF
jgi:hypothetical protein